jgi:hypothetical protein
VPKPGDNQTVVFAVFFDAGLRFPCNVLLPEILRLFMIELPQLSISALVRVAIFDWACRTAGFEPIAELFGAIFYAIVISKTVVTPAGTRKTVFGSANFNFHPERLLTTKFGKFTSDLELRPKRIWEEIDNGNRV